MNEEESIAKVIADVPQAMVREIIVCNNNSSDNTKAVAQEAGATVLDESRPGYGWACLKGMEYLNLKEVKPDIVVFLDGDYSDYPEELPQVIAPILDNDMDMVIGSRAIGERAEGSMTFPQRFGNWLATKLMKLVYKADYTDLGPFRAIRYDKLMQLGMRDKTYGWTIEMQIKAAKQKLKTCEVPVKYRQRIGHSKVSGTINGVIGAGVKIIGAIFRYL